MGACLATDFVDSKVKYLCSFTRKLCTVAVQLRLIQLMLKWKRENANSLAIFTPFLAPVPYATVVCRYLYKAWQQNPQASTMVALSIIGRLLYDVTRVFSAVLRLDGFR